MSHIRTELYNDLNRDQQLLIARCLVCRTQGAWTLDNFIQEHRHYEPEPPEPLTPEQREQVRLQGMHRRGALRCGNPMQRRWP